MLALLLSQTEYRAGDEVTGTVAVSDGAAHQVKVFLEWAVSGFASSSGTRAETTLSFAPGQGEQSFTLRLPKRTVTYRGRLASVAWGVIAEVGSPSHRASQAITVRSAAPRPELLFGTGGYREPAVAASTLKRRPARPPWRGVCTLVGLLLILPLTIRHSVTTDVTSRGQGPFVMMFFIGSVGALLLFAGLWMTVPFAIRRWLVAARFSIDDVEISEEARAGGVVKVRASIVRLRAIDELQITLVGLETASQGIGSGTLTKSEQLHREEQVFSGAALVPRTLELQLQVPEGAAPSFNVTDASVGWYVEIRAKIRSWPDFSHAFPVEISG